MSRCHHHPSAEKLLNYVSGHMTGLHRTMIELHLKVCSACQNAVSEFESLGGAVIESESEVALSAGCFNTLMQAIQSQPDTRSATETPTEATEFSDLLAEILLKGNASHLNWQWRTKRFAEIQLDRKNAQSESDGYQAKLIYFKKGMKVPRHTHRDKEFTLVLKGAFSDSQGRYERGDYLCRTAIDEHAPVAESDCICLAITTQPLKFTGAFGPVLNWFLN